LFRAASILETGSNQDARASAEGLSRHADLKHHRGQRLEKFHFSFVNSFVRAAACGQGDAPLTATLEKVVAHLHKAYKACGTPVKGIVGPRREN